MSKKIGKIGVVGTFVIGLMLAFQNCSGPSGATGGSVANQQAGGVVVDPGNTNQCPVTVNPAPQVVNINPTSLTFGIGRGNDEGTQSPVDVSMSFNSGDNISAIVDVNCNVMNNQGLNVTCNAPNNALQSGTIDIRIAAQNNAECESGTVTIAVTVEDAVVNTQGSPIGACNNLQQTSSARNFTVQVLNRCLATQRVNPDPAYLAGQMGNAVAIDGDVAVAVAPRDEESGLADSGAAYVMRRNGASWSIVDKLIPSGIQAGDNLYSAAISGNLIVLGAPLANGFAGRAWVYQFNGANWVEQRTLQVTGSGLFGTSVAISGSNIAIGSPRSRVGTLGTFSGAVYHYTNAGNSTPTVFAPSGGVTAFGEFGYDVAYSGTTLVVGAPFPGSQTARDEAVYVFENLNTTPARKLVHSSNVMWRYGYSVDVDGNNLVVGAPDFGGGEGRAFLYRKAGGVFPAQASLTYMMNDPNNDDVDRLGHDVTVSGTRVLASAPNKAEGQPKFGAVYLFNTTVADQQFKIRAPEADRGADSFGHSIAVSADGWLISGALNDEVVGEPDNAGAVYFVDLP